jgi:peptide-methionine (R)-S-oxide reductase
MDPTHDPIEVSNEEWKSYLSAEQYRILREKGTEPPFTGEYLNLKQEGLYHCVACSNPLFSSTAKVDSKLGWPSFNESLNEGSIQELFDTSFSKNEMEVICHRCRSHLGHVQKNGPTGKLYCINSIALKFHPNQ